MIYEIQRHLVFFALAAMILLFVIAATWQEVERTWTRARPFSRFVFFLAVGGITLFGGAKSNVGKITFANTDAEAAYISDAGSFVTNDYVHVAYSLAAGVPQSAPIVVERRLRTSTNETDWVCVTNVAARNFPSPQDIQFTAATNFNWIVYTTYTPGSAVVTNGVWHCWWGLDRKAKVEIIPLRTCIEVDGEVIATPESKKKAED